MADVSNAVNIPRQLFRVAVKFDQGRRHLLGCLLTAFRAARLEIEY